MSKSTVRLAALTLAIALFGLAGTTASGSASPGAIAQATCSAPAWDSSAYYQQGSVVAHNGHEWRANTFLWPGVEPGSGVPPWWVPWTDLGPCAPSSTTTSTPGSTTSTTAPSGSPRPPGQPASGPAGTDYPHGDWIVSQVGSGNDAAYVFQPTNPRPTSAPVAVMLHGFGEFSGYNVMHNFIRHTVRKGYVVIYPRWQTNIFSPGTGMAQTLPAAVNGIKGGLDWLRADAANRVQPQLDKVGYMGHSYGGMIAANIANRYSSLGLPAPKSLYLFEPYGGGLGDQFDASMSGIPATAKVSCQISQRFTETNRGCFLFFSKIGHIANADKDFVVSYSDTRGSPTLVADHFSICSPPAGASCYIADPTDPNRDFEREKVTDAQDFFAHWKRWVAIQSCANSGTLCAFGMNDTPENRDMGHWSDGVSVRPNRITDTPALP